jgi:hypothetical protein
LNIDALLDKFPGLELMSKEEINDLSKADIFAKLFAIVQSIWLVVQSITRVSVGLPITQLELATIALVFCALIMYALWWNKPFGVEHSVTIYTIYDGNLSAIIAGIKRVSGGGLPPSIDEREFLEHYFAWRLRAAVSGSESDRPPHNLTVERLIETALDPLGYKGIHGVAKFGKALGGLISTVFGKSRWIDLDRDFAMCIAFYSTSTIFSAFHIGAWNWEFPTPTIRTIWRSFALAATGIGPLTIVWGIIIESLPVDMTRRLLFLNVPTGGILFLMVTYILARLGLIVLIFYCFSSMPAAVYETVSWTQFLPHFA